MKIQFKKEHKDARTPTQGNAYSACWDLYAIDGGVWNVSDDYYVEYETGISMAIPEDYVGLIFPRSSLSKYDLVLANHVGVIDSDYRGTVKFRFKVLSPPNHRQPKLYKAGERLGQIMIIQRPYLEWEQVDELPETERSVNGFGSTGK